MWHRLTRMVIRPKDWLFIGATISAVLLSVCALNPGHPLAELARRAGLYTAVLCVFSRVVLFFLYRRRAD